MSFSKRLKAIVKEERFTQAKFADEVGVSRSAVEKYLSGENEPTARILMKIAQHQAFRKYTMWLLTGNVEPNSGQISPELSTQERCGLVVDKSNSRKQA
ncbi:helix-turn-helix domain-containing protein [Photobacterium damselae]|uniref:helix-turn-helix domain-containing protein n=1 Tax=Photobacterium damselae TaxID=38293 RepID=UPI0040686EF8